MNTNRAQDIISQVASLTGQFGASVTITRTTTSPGASTDVFGTPVNPTPPIPFTTSVIVESLKKNVMPTLVGMKPKEELRLIANEGIFLENDEVQYSGHIYKVNFVEPVPFMGSDVVDFVHAQREVDA